MTTFVRNAWYAAATSDEVGRALLARNILAEPIVFFRKEDGGAVALEDRCSHRFMPLSKGSLKADTVVCCYHGLEFDPAGRCVRIPAQDNVPPGASIRSYPAIDRWSLLWVWMGDPALADPALIPDLWQHAHPDWRLSLLDRLYVRGDYRLLADNLLDPSHVAFLHKTTLGSDVAEIPHQTEIHPDCVRVTRWTLDKPVAPIFARMRAFNGNVDRWQIMTFRPPCLTEVDLGSCETGTGAPEGDRSHGIEMRSFNIATPADEHSFHYFISHVRNFALDDPSLSKVTRDQIMIALAEDIEAMELVHAGFQRFAGKEPINTRADGAGLRARRLIDAMAGGLPA